MKNIKIVACNRMITRNKDNKSLKVSTTVAHRMHQGWWGSSTGCSCSISDTFGLGSSWGISGNNSNSGFSNPWGILDKCGRSGLGNSCEISDNGGNYGLGNSWGIYGNEGNSSFGSSCKGDNSSFGSVGSSSYGLSSNKTRAASQGELLEKMCAKRREHMMIKELEAIFREGQRVWIWWKEEDNACGIYSEVKGVLCVQDFVWTLWVLN